ncbi:MAG: cysteine--tRNA ligase [Holosporales bacterium]|jgi:cysteinyl-tRNA synthetase|nr:cysteine--tRNA ligase [Holosporales bacterium]
MMRLYNTLTQRVAPFVALNNDIVQMYVCGPTVYDRPHVGNARSIIVFDILYRVLTYLYPRVIYVRNITDVDDKINTRAAERGISIKSLTMEIEGIFQEDLARLGALPPTFEPHATDHMLEIICIIIDLITLEYAYVKEGHVLFRVRKDPHYGDLSHRNIDNMITGSRVESASYKEDPLDFVLWKPSSVDMPGWDSPWGRGRPGWHIECSAMCRKYFRHTFDIHGGGQDLIFPHHENEIAQSRAINEERFIAHTWVHNGIVLMDGQKMSKSSGNVLPLATALEAFDSEVIRYFFLSTHYRKSLNWTQKGLEQAKHCLARLYGALREFIPPMEETYHFTRSNVVAVLYDDLNTPQALRLLQEKASAIYKETDVRKKAALQEELQRDAYVMGLLEKNVQNWEHGSGFKDLPEEEIDRLIEEREAARAARDFARSDAFRDALLQQGIALEDTAEGTRWHRV